MARRLLVLVAVGALLAPLTPSAADHLSNDPSPPDPMNRVNAMVPKAAGTFDTIVLQYGPYVVGPGSDLIRVDVEPVVHDFQVIAARPAVRDVFGNEPPDEVIHIHHAHWIKPNPSNPPEYYDWFFGTGEERTRGGGWAYMASDADTWAEGTRFGIPMERGEQMVFVSMLHNKTPAPMLLWLEGRFEIVWGSREEIREATAGDPEHELWGDEAKGIPTGTYQESGIDFVPLTPVLHGRTFQVPRVGGDYVYPRDVGLHPNDPNNVEPQGALSNQTGGVFAGIGHIWTAPADGVIGIGAGHLHPGGKEVVVSNLGRPDSPCGPTFGADGDGDGFAGVTILRIDAFYRTDDDSEFVRSHDLVDDRRYFPSEEYQVGITQPGWRTYVRAGDRLAINGIYDARDFAYPDAMSFFGFYVDTEAAVAPSQTCTASLIDGTVTPDPVTGAVDPEVVRSLHNRPWDFHPGPIFCDPGSSEGEGACNQMSRAVTDLGQRTPVINIAGFAYVPGQDGVTQLTGVPYVNRGEALTIVNQDWVAGLVRHSVTSCAWPCNGGYFANYPFHDGAFDSGALGLTALDTYETAQDLPMWTLDTGGLDEGFYAFYCRLHPAMRGSFAVVD